jgi:hypothetical protein
MEATIFTGWIYDHLLPHAQQVKVAHPLMLRAIAVLPALQTFFCVSLCLIRFNFGVFDEGRLDHS